MRLRQLKVNLSTTDGPYGTTLNFPDGLVVIWADNSMGKSTCMRAIVVALGMEAMLTTSRSELPLTPALTTKLERDKKEYVVLESEVFLEIENKHGRRIVVQRTLKGTRDKNLITVHCGPALSEPGSYETADYFVNRAGGATRDVGFHRFLADFLDWNLPVVQTYEGAEPPLYLQCILPFVMTEQTRGWSTIQPPVPTQFQIKEVHKRVIEFLLGMDAHKIALERQELQLRRTRLEARWTLQMKQLRAIAASAGGVVREGPSEPTSVWPPQIPPYIQVPQEKQWSSLDERIRLRQAKQEELNGQNIPSVQEVSDKAREELLSAEEEVQRRQAVLARLIDALSSEEQEVVRVQERLGVIKEDIQRNKDAKTLRDLGSRSNSDVDHGSCPVCHQSIADTLIPLAAGQSVMSLEQNIEFLSEQSRTFEGVLEQGKRVVDARRHQVNSAREELSKLRERVRHLRQTLVSDGRGPSVAAVYERVELERDLKQDVLSRDLFTRAVGEFSGLASEWKTLLTDLESIPKVDLSDDDTRKLKSWEASLREQLASYGFGSLTAAQVEISPLTYRPEHEGFELQTTISASDLIRTIWAYLSGMLEVARVEKTNHPGMLMFDEPRQQSARDVSFAALLARAANAIKFNQQVIFFTSEERDRLKPLLAGLQHTLREIEGRVIKKQSEQV